jgi:hypothetical protein
MKKNIISTALAGSVLVATSMSANATTAPVSIAFSILPALIILPVDPFVPGDVLTGTSGSTCVWTPTFLDEVTGASGAVTDVNVVRSGNGCPGQPIATGSAATVGVYTVDGGSTAVNVDIQIELETGLGTNISWEPIGVASPTDESYPSVSIPTDTPTTVNTGGLGIVTVYIGGTSTVTSATDIITGENVSYNIIAIY